MKTIDIKSALIGVFFTTTVIFSLGAATGHQDRDVKSPMWDSMQTWDVKYMGRFPATKAGWEPFAWDGKEKCAWRRRGN